MENILEAERQAQSGPPALGEERTHAGHTLFLMGIRPAHGPAHGPEMCQHRFHVFPLTRLLQWNQYTQGTRTDWEQSLLRELW